MELTIKINLDNEAFEESKGARWQEIARILHYIALRIPYDYGDNKMNVQNINGNTVGYAEITE